MSSPSPIRLPQLICEYPRLVSLCGALLNSADYDKYAKAVETLTTACGKSLRVLRDAIHHEFHTNINTPGSIMRGRDVASKLMGKYVRRVAGEFLKGTILPFLMEILGDTTMSLEIDPLKVTGGLSEIEANRQRLEEYTKKALDAITSEEVVSKLSEEFLALCYILASTAKGINISPIPMIGGFVMLRLVNPCLVAPESFQILPEDVVVSRAARRNLTLISKVLQNLSNGVEFGAKEEYMTILNPFLAREMGKMESFLARLASLDEGGKEALDVLLRRPSATAQQVDENAMYGLHSLLYNIRGKISIAKDTWPKSVRPGAEELVQLLETLPKPEPKKTRSRSGSAPSRSSAGEGAQFIVDLYSIKVENIPPKKTAKFEINVKCGRMGPSFVKGKGMWGKRLIFTEGESEHQLFAQVKCPLEALDELVFGINITRVGMLRHLYGSFQVPLMKIPFVERQDATKSWYEVPCYDDSHGQVLFRARMYFKGLRDDAPPPAAYQAPSKKLAKHTLAVVRENMMFSTSVDFGHDDLKAGLLTQSEGKTGSPLAIDGDGEGSYEDDIGGSLPPIQLRVESPSDSALPSGGGRSLAPGSISPRPDEYSDPSHEGVSPRTIDSISPGGSPTPSPSVSPVRPRRGTAGPTLGEPRGRDGPPPRKGSLSRPTPPPRRPTSPPPPSRNQFLTVEFAAAPRGDGSGDGTTLSPGQVKRQRSVSSPSRPDKSVFNAGPPRPPRAHSPTFLASSPSAPQKITTASAVGTQRTRMGGAAIGQARRGRIQTEPMFDVPGAVVLPGLQTSPSTDRVKSKPKERSGPRGGGKRPHAPMLKRPSSPAEKLVMTTLETLPLPPRPPPLDEDAAARVLQRCFRSLRLRRTVEKALFMARRRRMVAKEIQQTERTYVTTLVSIREIFVRPLSGATGVSNVPITLTDDDMVAVFSNIEEILELHNRRVLPRLTSRLRNWDHKQGLGDVFVEMASSLHVYSKYINNYIRGLEHFKELDSKNKELHEWLQTHCISPDYTGAGLSLWSDLSITPVQRIPRYELLLQQLLSHTHELHSDYEPLKQAIAAIESVSRVINEQRRASDILQRVDCEGGGEEVVRGKHDLRTVSIKIPHLCVVCKRNIYSLKLRALKCSRCGSFVHKDCVSSLDPVCLAKETMAKFPQDLSGRTALRSAPGWYRTFVFEKEECTIFLFNDAIGIAVAKGGKTERMVFKEFILFLGNDRRYIRVQDCSDNDTPNALLITHGQHLSTLFFESDEVKDAWLNDITMSIKAKRTSLTSANLLE